MLRLRTVAGIGLVALLLNAGLILVPGGGHFGVAYATGDGVINDPTRTEAPPTAGDPDGPTGDIAPPTSGTISEPSYQQPFKRMIIWAQLPVALKLWLRFSLVRY